MKNFTLFRSHYSRALFPVKYIVVYSMWLVITFYLVGCQNSNDNENGPEFEERIIWGKSIDSIEIGDDSLTVVQKLGDPDHISPGDFLGSVLEYLTGMHALMDVAVSRDSALGLGVIFVGVDPPYGGTTAEGIGIGTLRNVALSHFGEPDETRGNWDTYYFKEEEIAFNLQYDEADKIFRINMRGPLRYIPN